MPIRALAQNRTVNDKNLILTRIRTYLINYKVPVFFHSCTLHLDTIKVFYLPTEAQ